MAMHARFSDATEESPRIIDSECVNLLVRNAETLQIWNQLASDEQHSIRRINCFSPFFRILWKQRPSELAILREKEFIGEASVDEQFDAFRPSLK